MNIKLLNKNKNMLIFFMLVIIYYLYNINKNISISGFSVGGMNASRIQRLMHGDPPGSGGSCPNLTRPEDRAECCKGYSYSYCNRASNPAPTNPAPTNPAPTNPASNPAPTNPATPAAPGGTT